MSLREFAAVAGYEAAIIVTMSAAVPARYVRAVEALDGVVVSEINPPNGEATGHMTLLVDRWQPRLLEELGRALDGAPIVEMRVRAAGLEEAFATLTKGPSA
jgi:hypothetical protein